MTGSKAATRRNPFLAALKVLGLVVSSPLWVLPYVTVALVRPKHRPMLGEGEILTIKSVGPQFVNLYLLEASLVLGLIYSLPHVEPHLLSWIWSSVALFTLCVMHGTNWPRNRVVFAATLLTAIVAPMIVAEGLSEHFDFFHWLWRQFKSWDFLVSRAVMLFWAAIMLIFQVIHWCGVGLDGRWKLSNNDFQRFRAGDDTMSFTRENLVKVMFSYPDWCERFLLGLGNITFEDINGKIYVIERVLGLPRLEHHFRNLLRAEAEVTAPEDEEEDKKN